MKGNLMGQKKYTEGEKGKTRAGIQEAKKYIYRAL